MVILHSISRNEGTSLIGRHCSFSHLHVYTWHCLDIVDSAHCHCYLDQDLGRRNEGGNNMLTVKSSPVTISGGSFTWCDDQVLLVTAHTFQHFWQSFISHACFQTHAVCSRYWREFSLSLSLSLYPSLYLSWSFISAAHLSLVPEWTENRGCLATVCLHIRCR